MGSSERLQDTYEFNGDTDPELAFVRSTDIGLQVGVEPMPNLETHNGYFAVTHDAYPESSVFHVRHPGNHPSHGRPPHFDGLVWQ